MMDERGFIQFMSETKKTPSTIKRYLEGVLIFDTFLAERKEGKHIDDTTREDILAFVQEKRDKIKPPVLNACIYGLMNYFKYRSNKELYNASREVSGGLSIEQYKLRNFMGIDKEHVSRLESLGIKTAKHMLDHGKTRNQRDVLSQRTGIPSEILLELVKLSDLARIGGLKKKRARLFYDAGFDTIEKIAEQDPDALRNALIAYIEKSGFDGSASTAGEAEYTVTLARYIPRIVEYSYS